MMMKQPQIILPEEFKSDAGLVRLRPQVVPLGIDESVLEEFILRPRLYAATEYPSFFDQIGSYITHQEVLELIYAREFAPYALQEMTVDGVIRRVRDLPFEPTMRFLASLQKALSRDRLDREWQCLLAREIYGTGDVGEAMQLLMREPGRVVFTEQQVFALMRLVVLHASEREADDLAPEEHVALRVALLLIPGTVLEAATQVDPVEGVDPTTEQWMRYFIGNGGLAQSTTLRHELARAHRMYEVIAKSPPARKHHDHCDLDAWLQEAYGLTFVELQGLGISIFAGSKVADDGEIPSAVGPSYFDSTTLGGRTGRALAAISSERAWFREQFAKTQEKERYAAFEIHPFLQRPCLFQQDGRAIVLSPRGIDSWLGTAGTYYRLLDVARERGKQDFHRFLRFNGWIQERYVRHLGHVAHPRLRTSLAVRQVVGEVAYWVGNQKMMTNDITIADGLDVVLFETTAKRLTAGSLIEANAETVARDLSQLVLEKMRQLGRVIRHLCEGQAAPPGIELQHVKRIWPVIVASDVIFQNPSLREYLQRQGGAHLAIPTALTRGVTVQPLLILELEEYERLMGIVQEGHSLVEVLTCCTQPAWVSRGLKAWHHGDTTGRIGSGESAFIDDEFARAYCSLMRALGIRKGRAVTATTSVVDSALEAA